MISRTITTEYMKRYVKKEINKIETMFVGIVVGVDHEREKYNIQPILKHIAGDGDVLDSPIIAECPMCFTKTKNFYIRAPYVVGDVVYVGCSKDSIDESTISNDVTENRISGVSSFRLVDGVILGGVMVEDEPSLDSNYVDDFIIQNRDNNDLFVIKRDGGVIVKTETKITIDSPVTEITGSLNVSGDTTIGSTLDVTGGISSDGIIESQIAIKGKIVQETTGGKTL